MFTLDRYVLRETLKPLAYALVIVLGALLLERLIRLLDMLLSKGGPLVLVLQLLANLLPHYLGLALPAAFYVSVLLAVAKFGSDSELDAMQATGVSLPRLVAPLFVLAAVLSVGSVLLMGFLQPYSRYAYRATVYALTNMAWDARLEQGVFVTDGGRFTISADRLAEGGRRMANVFVNQELKSGGSVTTTAREGALVRGRNMHLALELHDGVQIRWDGQRDRGASLTFSSLSIPLDTVLPEPFRPRGGSRRELTLVELWEMRAAPDAEVPRPEVLAELHGRIVRSLSLLVLPFLAVPLGMSAKRARRSYGLAVAAILLLLYDHVLQFGQGFVELGEMSPALGLWAPFAAFTGLSFWLFWRVSSLPGSNPVDHLIEEIAGRLSQLLRWPWRRRRRVAAEAP